MILEPSQALVRLRALIASVRRLACMREHVLLELAGLSESIVAQFTRVRLHAHVRTHVVSQVGRVCEGVMTHVAYVGLHSCVRVNMRG